MSWHRCSRHTADKILTEDLGIPEFRDRDGGNRSISEALLAELPGRYKRWQDYRRALAELELAKLKERDLTRG